MPGEIVTKTQSACDMAFTASRPGTRLRTITYRTGMKTRISVVAAIIPPKTVAPTEMRPARPAPCASTNGTTPRMNASEVLVRGCMSRDGCIRRPRMSRPEEGKAIQDLLLELFEVKIDGRSDEKGDELRHNQPADHNEPQRPARGAIRPVAEGDGQGAHERGHGGHHDGTEAAHAGVVNCLIVWYTVLDALLREVHDHDSVFLHDAHEHEHADEPV